MTRFLDAYNARVAKGFPICIGLDPDPKMVPEVARRARQAGSSRWLNGFIKAIVHATSDCAGAYKLNWAFYVRHKEEGLRLLKETVLFIRDKGPNVPIILDGKFSDIGNTNSGFIELIEWLEVDAFTVVPFVGFEDGIKPFFELRDRQVFVWVRSSNKSAGDLQDMRVVVGDSESTGTMPLWQALAEKAYTNWNPYGNLGLIVGAPYVSELATCRKIAPDLPFLVPGVGAQGGKISEIVPKGRIDRMELGLVINEGRSIIHASNEDDFDSRARVRAMISNKEIMDALAS